MQDKSLSDSNDHNLRKGKQSDDSGTAQDESSNNHSDVELSSEEEALFQKVIINEHR